MSVYGNSIDMVIERQIISHFKTRIAEIVIYSEYHLYY